MDRLSLNPNDSLRNHSGLPQIGPKQSWTLFSTLSFENPEKKERADRAYAGTMIDCKWL